MVYPNVFGQDHDMHQAITHHDRVSTTVLVGITHHRMAGHKLHCSQAFRKCLLRSG